MRFPYNVFGIFELNVFILKRPASNTGAGAYRRGRGVGRGGNG
jgi:hypothetical protein